jgi:hypothetical protein
MGILPEIQPTLLILENGMRQDLQDQQDKLEMVYGSRRKVHGNDDSKQ